MRNRVTHRLVLTVLMFMVLCPAASAAQTLTYVDLVNRLTDLQRLATLPQPGEGCAQWSSYDRASRYDDATEKYINWDANGDNNGIIRTEGTEQVLAEMKGPGCIWRIWSALPQAGHVKIYLEGATEPTVDLPFSGYFDHKNAPFTYPALVHNVNGGQNCYVPIPYQKSCKVVADANWGGYYHFTYGSFPRGTTVPTFTRDLGPIDRAALDRVDHLLAIGLGSDPAGRRKGEKTVVKDLSIPAGGVVTAAQFGGKDAITGIHIKLVPSVLTDPGTALRQVALRIYWDGEKTPSVWAPLGDFFGTAPGINQHRSLPLGMAEDGSCYCYWYMPFSKGARVELLNESPFSFPLQVSITHARPSGNGNGLGRFHVKWHRDALLPTDPDRKIDWTMLKTTGPGRFCGVMLHIWNPKAGWWGEGDEKFFVDGEKFPSTFGTGSEDYFGYAWGNPQLFQHAFHNQTISEGNVGNISVNRFQIIDNVPFQQSFEGDIEKYWANDRPALYACTAYWYQAPGQVDPYGPVPAADRIGYYGRPRPLHVAGVLEGEDLKVLQKTGGAPGSQDMSPFQGAWSGNSQLLWPQARVGDQLTLALPVKTAGRYEIKVQMTKAVDYGIVQFSLDGQMIGAPVDLYYYDVAPTGEISLGTVDLTAGDHSLMLEITGANDAAKKSYLVGLDYVRLVKSP